MSFTKVMVAVCAVGGAAGVSQAGIGVVSLGTGVPPATLGPASLALTAGLPDSSALLTPVTTAPLSSQTSLSFIGATPLHRAAPAWFSLGYTGSIYDTDPATSMTIVPFGSNQIDALVLYAVPNAYGVFNFSVTGSDGSTTVTAVNAVNGKPFNAGTAYGWGFYGTGTSKILSVTLSCDVPFSVGRFSYHNPSPSAAALLGLAAVRRKRR